MKKKNEENRHAESLEESLKALFGEEGDLTDAELDEELDACGIDAVELQANVHKQLFDYSSLPNIGQRRSSKPGEDATSTPTSERFGKSEGYRQDGGKSRR
jgi:hypothetical protein